MSFVGIVGVVWQLSEWGTCRGSPATTGHRRLSDIQRSSCEGHAYCQQEKERRRCTTKLERCSRFSSIYGFYSGWSVIYGLISNWPFCIYGRMLTWKTFQNSENLLNLEKSGKTPGICVDLQKSVWVGKFMWYSTEYCKKGVTSPDMLFVLWFIIVFQLLVFLSWHQYLHTKTIKQIL